jgi:hypothetical protein
MVLRSAGKPVKLALVSGMSVVTSPESPELVQVAFVHVALPVMPFTRGYVAVGAPSVEPVPSVMMKLL